MSLTPIEKNAEACARECRAGGTGACDWPKCPCPAIAPGAEVKPPFSIAAALDRMADGEYLNPSCAWPFPAARKVA